LLDQQLMGLLQAIEATVGFSQAVLEDAFESRFGIALLLVTSVIVLDAAIAGP
jgi:hypothetical protein